ncbi:mucin-2 isoform X2 [Patella vulgata]|uniref:mucin-2 isoform X2 n=1 Tax=Patella vulgata TaxID=6465 RepID=UPI00217F9FA0|nr:mucin-2 isoform X2 [Patella vulgata]
MHRPWRLELQIQQRRPYDNEASGESSESDGKDKKKKLKPFEAFRRLFKSTRKRSSKSKDDPQVSIVSVKAKSTTALHSGSNEDDDDEGGFKSNRTLQGTRSISEDSVFNPELKEANPESLKKTAVSEENIHKSTFQAELFAKLKSRQSVCSDDDDAGLPHSPTPPVTTADIIMGGGLKPLPVSGKSMSRESETSLISEDGSDNDEEDAFDREWKSSVAAVTSSKVIKSPAKERNSLDFSSVQTTEVLSNKVSRDKLNISKNRRSRAPSRKKKEDKSAKTLPGVKEESPTKTQTQSIFSEETPSISQLSSSLPTNLSDDKPKAKISQATSTKVIAAQTSQNKTVELGLNKDSESANKSEVILRSASTKSDTDAPSEKHNELSQAFGKLKKPSSTDNEASAKSEQKTVELQPKELKLENTENKTKPEEKIEINVQSVDKSEENKQNEDPTKKSVISLRPTDSKDSVSSSPKEEYRLKRQNRSKTLPVASDAVKEAVKDEQTTVKVQRANSQRVDAESSPRGEVTKRQSVILPLTSTTKQIETKRLSWVEESHKSSGEPDWLANLKKKKSVKDETSPTEEVKTVVPEKVEVKKAESPVKPLTYVKTSSVVNGKSTTKPTETKPLETSSDKTETDSKKTTLSATTDPKTTSFGGSKVSSINTQHAKINTSNTKVETKVVTSSISSTTPSAAKSSIADRISSLKGTPASETPKSAPEKNVTTKPVAEKSVTPKPEPEKSVTPKPEPEKSVALKPTSEKNGTTPVSTKPMSTIASRFTPTVSSISTASKFTPSVPSTKSAVSRTISIPTSSKAADITSNTKPVISQTGAKPQTVSQIKPVSTATSKMTSATTKNGSTTAKETSTSATPTSDVPNWRRNLGQKKSESSSTVAPVSNFAPVKIELIENSAPSTKPEKKVEIKNSGSTESELAAEKWSDNANNRKSKVLDMVKNFQKLEVT